MTLVWHEIEIRAVKNLIKLIPPGKMKPNRQLKEVYLWKLNCICSCHNFVLSADYPFYPWFLVFKFWLNAILTQAETTLILFWVIWFQSFFNKIWCAGNFHHNIWSIRTDIIEVVLLEVLWSFVTKSFKLMGEGLGKILLFAPLSVIIFNDFVHWVELFAMPLLFNLLR